MNDGVDAIAEVTPHLERLLGRRVTSLEPKAGGLTHAFTGVATLDAGDTVFVKAGLRGASTSQVRAETANLRWLTGSFVPEVVATSDDPPMLVLEDLSHAHWPEPYPQDVESLVAALEELRTLPVPDDRGLLPVDPPSGAILSHLAENAREALPACADWVVGHADSLRAAIGSIAPARALVHSDLWYSNVCFLEDRAVIVDWSHLSIGSPWFDSSTISVDLVIEGRPPLTMEDGAGWAAAHVAWVLYALARGAGDAISDPAAWRSDNVELFDGAAHWFAREIGVEPPPVQSERSVGW